MTRNLSALFVCLFLIVIALPSAAADTGDDSAIKGVALDYLMGWYTGDAERMERALHPDLAKRIVRVDPKGKRDRVDHMSALTLVQYTRMGFGTKVPVEERVAEITILDRFGNAAVVKAVARDWVDYLQIGKVNGEWKIINVLWEMKPRPEN
ncbi:MAG: nuclear transport factor 2 family protein [Acidobacteria bacterium]|jgi:hypothetical protein|nr:nuclear transport factor 2 family protein [Acidobacteriota bacterium]